MEETQEKLNIYQKLAKIRKPVEILQKNKAGYGYKYVTEDAILARITGLMDRLGVSLIPQINPGTIDVEPYHYVKTKTTKAGDTYEEHVNEILVHCDMQWVWINNEDPDDRVVVPWAMVGQQSDASQAFGSGLSYASRYFMLKYFNVATSEDDPDRWRSAQKEAEATEDRAIAEGIIATFDTAVRQFIADNPDKTDEVKKFITRFVKSGNYNSIKDPTLAAKLLEDFKKLYIKEN